MANDLTKEWLQKQIALSELIDWHEPVQISQKLYTDLCRAALQAPQFQPAPPSDVVEKVARAIERAIQFDPIFGKEKMPDGDWVTTIGQIEAISRISKLAALEAITRLGVKGE